MKRVIHRLHCNRNPQSACRDAFLWWHYGVRSYRVRVGWGGKLVI